RRTPLKPRPDYPTRGQALCGGRRCRVISRHPAAAVSHGTIRPRALSLEQVPPRSHRKRRGFFADARLPLSGDRVRIADIRAEVQTGSLFDRLDGNAPVRDIDAGKLLRLAEALALFAEQRQLVDDQSDRLELFRAFPDDHFPER